MLFVLDKYEVLVVDFVFEHACTFFTLWSDVLQFASRSQLGGGGSKGIRAWHVAEEVRALYAQQHIAPERQELLLGSLLPFFWCFSACLQIWQRLVFLREKMGLSFACGQCTQVEQYYRPGKGRVAEEVQKLVTLLSSGMPTCKESKLACCKIRAVFMTYVNRYPYRAVPFK